MTALEWLSGRVLKACPIHCYYFQCSTQVYPARFHNRLIQKYKAKTSECKNPLIHVRLNSFPQCIIALSHTLKISVLGAIEFVTSG